MHTFGGRRIEDPLRGGTAAHPLSVAGSQGKDSCALGVLGVLGFLGFLGVLGVSSVKRPLRRNEPLNGRKFRKIVPYMTLWASTPAIREGNIILNT